MTEQQACTLCGMEGHTPAQCIWNGNEKALALVQEIDKRNAARSAQAQPSPAPELERPEVVAWQYEPYLGSEHYGKPKLAFVQPYSTDRNVEPLMTVSQHKHIDAARLACVGILADEILKLSSERDAAQASFKNFHRGLCERFGYVHDEKDWQRDQLSLSEHIAKQAAQAGRLANGYTGWVTQYPGRAAKLWGSREIAELNWWPEDGQQLFRVVEVERIAAAPAPGGE